MLKRKLEWSWHAQLKDCKKWEKECENAFQKFRKQNPIMSDKVPFLAMIYKTAYVDCLKLRNKSKYYQERKTDEKTHM